MKNFIIICLACLLGTTLWAATIYTTDFIADATRTHFNGFEGIGGTTNYGSVYIEGGIRVEQINGDGNDIWTTYSPSGREGSYLWYPNGGDNGYTKITRLDGLDFFNFGILVGSGGSATSLYYELRNNGSIIQSGTMSHTSAMHYLGFGGGGFDEVLLKEGTSLVGVNALAVDAIELSGVATPVPEPFTLSFLLLGIVFFFVQRKTRN